LDSPADLLDEPQAALRRQAALIAVLVDAQAFDVLHDEVGRTELRVAAIQQARDTTCSRMAMSSPHSLKRKRERSSAASGRARSKSSCSRCQRCGVRMVFWSRGCTGGIITGRPEVRARDWVNVGGPDSVAGNYESTEAIPCRMANFTRLVMSRISSLRMMRLR
jgi:hypothetical protein